MVAHFLLLLLCVALRADDAAIGATVDVFHATNDLEDFRDSLQRIAKLASTRVASVVDAAPLAFSEGDKATLRRAARAADFTEEETKQLLDRAQRLDESVVGAVQVLRCFHVCATLRKIHGRI